MRRVSVTSGVLSTPDLDLNEVGCVGSFGASAKRSTLRSAIGRAPQENFDSRGFRGRFIPSCSDETALLSAQRSAGKDEGRVRPHMRKRRVMNHESFKRLTNNVIGSGAMLHLQFADRR